MKGERGISIIKINYSENRIIPGKINYGDKNGKIIMGKMINDDRDKLSFQFSMCETLNKESFLIVCFSLFCP